MFQLSKSHLYDFDNYKEATTKLAKLRDQHPFVYGFITGVLDNYEVADLPRLITKSASLDPIINKVWNSAFEKIAAPPINTQGTAGPVHPINIDDPAKHLNFGAHVQPPAVGHTNTPDIRVGKPLAPADPLPSVSGKPPGTLPKLIQHGNATLPQHSEQPVNEPNLVQPLREDTTGYQKADLTSHLATPEQANNVLFPYWKTLKPEDQNLLADRMSMQDRTRLLQHWGSSQNPEAQQAAHQVSDRYNQQLSQANDMVNASAKPNHYNMAAIAAERARKGNSLFKGFQGPTREAWEKLPLPYRLNQMDEGYGKFLKEVNENPSVVKYDPATGYQWLDRAILNTAEGVGTGTNTAQRLASAVIPGVPDQTKALFPDLSQIRQTMNEPNNPNNPKVNQPSYVGTSDFTEKPIETGLDAARTVGHFVAPWSLPGTAAGQTAAEMIAPTKYQDTARTIGGFAGGAGGGFAGYKGIQALRNFRSPNLVPKVTPSLSSTPSPVSTSLKVAPSAEQAVGQAASPLAQAGVPAAEQVAGQAAPALGTAWNPKNWLPHLKNYFTTPFREGGGFKNLSNPEGLKATTWQPDAKGLLGTLGNVNKVLSNPLQPLFRQSWAGGNVNNAAAGLARWGATRGGQYFGYGALADQIAKNRSNMQRLGEGATIADQALNYTSDAAAKILAWRSPWARWGALPSYASRGQDSWLEHEKGITDPAQRNNLNWLTAPIAAAGTIPTSIWENRETIANAPWNKALSLPGYFLDKGMNAYHRLGAPPDFQALSERTDEQRARYLGISPEEYASHGEDIKALMTNIGNAPNRNAPGFNATNNLVGDFNGFLNKQYGPMQDRTADLLLQRSTTSPQLRDLSQSRDNLNQLNGLASRATSPQQVLAFQQQLAKQDPQGLLQDQRLKPLFAAAASGDMAGFKNAKSILGAELSRSLTTTNQKFQKLFQHEHGSDPLLKHLTDTRNMAKFKLQGVDEDSFEQALADPKHQFWAQSGIKPEAYMQSAQPKAIQPTQPQQPVSISTARGALDKFVGDTAPSVNPPEVSPVVPTTPSVAPAAPVNTAPEPGKPPLGVAPSPVAPLAPAVAGTNEASSFAGTAPGATASSAFAGSAVVGVQKLMQDKTFLEQAKNLPPEQKAQMAQSVWSQLPDKYKNYVYAGIGLSTIGLLHRLFRSRNEDEEGSDYLSPLLGLGGLATAGYGLSQGKPQDLITPKFWSSLGNDAYSLIGNKR